MVFKLTARQRDNQTPDIVRSVGYIPAILYGRARESVSVAVDYSNFEKLYRAAGESSLVDLTIEDVTEPTKVLIQDVQIDPVKSRIIHVDFLQVQMDVAMNVEIPLHFVGISQAVKELAGTFNSSLTHVNVRCLPKDLLSAIEVDISALKTFNDAIEVQHLIVPPGITITDQPDSVVATVIAPLSEQELKAMEEVTPRSIEDVEVEDKGKKEVEGETVIDEIGREK